MTKSLKVLNKPSNSPDPNSVKHPWAPMSWPQYAACWLVNLCLNFTSWEFLLLCQCSKPRSDEQVANPNEGPHMYMAATCQSYDRPALLLFWTRIYKVNFKFCNTLSNNMGKLFPQTKNLKKPLQIQTSALCWRPQNISTCPIYVLYMTKSCFSRTTNFTQYLGGSFNAVADWLLLQLITLNENKLKQTRMQDFQISTDKQHQKRDWRTPSQTITWSHFSVAVA